MVYLSLIISTLLTVMNVPYDAVMNAHENMRYYALVGILESFSNSPWLLPVSMLRAINSSFMASL